MKQSKIDALRNAPSKIFNTFFKERGWLHNTGMLAVVYLLLVWGHSNYAQHTELVPSAMIADLIDTGVFWSMLGLSFFAFVCGWLIETAEESVGGKYSWWDIAWTTLGAPFAFILYRYFPHNTVVLVVSILYVVFTIYLLYRTFKTKK